MEFYTFTLPNGIRCIHKRTSSPVIHLALSINAGSRDEKDAEQGMAHLVEHTIFKGTTHRKAYHINSLLENLGGEINAYTTKEDTVIYTTCLKSDVNKAADLISDIAFRSTFPEKEINKEKKVIFDEINCYKDTPSERIYDDFEDLIFTSSDLGHNILGRKATVNKLDGNDIRRFVERTYTTDQMVFSSIGNLSAKRFAALADRYFGWVTASTRNFQRIKPTDTAAFSKNISRSTHQLHAIMGKKAYGMEEERRLPLVLLTNILGGPSANSMLNVLLREQNGLSYTVETSYTPFSDSGIASIYFSCDKEQADACIELIDGLLRRIRTDSLTARQLSMAKRQFFGQFIISGEGAEGYMLSAAKSYMVFDQVDSTEDIYNKLYSISRDDIACVANEIFSDLSYLIYK